MRPEGSLDVVVIGGGPAGAAAAARLAQAGLSVTVLERHVDPRPKVCGEFLSPECSIYLGRIGAGEAFRCLPAVPIETVGLYWGRRAVTADLNPPAWGLSRFVFDDWLLQWASLCGAQVLQGYEATAVFRVDDGFCVRARHVRDLTEVEFRTRFVAGAFGVKSGAAVPLAGLAPPHRQKGGFIAFSAHLRCPAVDRRVELYFLERGYIGLASVEAGRVNLAGIVEPTFFRRLGARFPTLLEYLTERNPAFRERLHGASDWTAFRATVHPGFGPRRRVWNGVALIGDQAGCIHPFSGDGIGMALQSALLWAEHVLEALADRLRPEVILERYDRQWRQTLAARLRMTHWLDWLRRRSRGLSITLDIMERYPSLLMWIYRRTRGLVSPSRGEGSGGPGCAGSP
ncbi:MAG: NAD(P)/FAD-dependent oxidoreductase [Acidobacteria bacterium]|nr:NAD(P)/FAD-dependent oxidoreductase [Acidobacteriota bacterium]MDW7983104.1 NAD(P)/FAD-dependent oxidoreductase [Acidobacteriota bacterium]